MNDQKLCFRLNGRPVEVETSPHRRLLDLLREELDHTGTKEGCGEGECGACTVIVDDRVVNACLYPALEAQGCDILTIEGLAEPGGGLSPVQLAFLDEGGTQCGFCTPGMVMSAHGLLSRNSDPTDEQIHEALRGNLCRCTGYVQIIDAIKRAARVCQDSSRASGQGAGA